MYIFMKKTKKLGPGGMQCPCCWPMDSKKLTKKLLNREIRRNGKQLINEEVIDMFEANERKARLVSLFWDFAQDEAEPDAVWVAKRLCDEFTGLSDVIEHTAQTERLALNH